MDKTNKDILIVLAYIMYYDMLQNAIDGSFFSKIDYAIELAEKFAVTYPEDYDWEENNFEDTIQDFLSNHINQL